MCVGVCVCGCLFFFFFVFCHALSLFFVFVLLPKLKAKTITHGGYTGKTAKQLLQTAPCFLFQFPCFDCQFCEFYTIVNINYWISVCGRSESSQTKGNRNFTTKEQRKGESESVLHLHYTNLFLLSPNPCLTPFFVFRFSFLSPQFLVAKFRQINI